MKNKKIKTSEPPLITLLGYIKGKLSISPKEAKQLFQFHMKPRSKGLIFYQRKAKQIIRNWSHTKPYKPTQTQKINNQKFKTLTYIASKICKPIIWQIWNPIANSKKELNLSGHLLFIKTNFKRIGSPPDWNKLLISKSNKRHFKPPKCLLAFFCKHKKLIQIKVEHPSFIKRKSNKELFILILNINKAPKFSFVKKEPCLLYLIHTKKFKGRKINIKFKAKLSDPIIFLFYILKNNSSNSISINPLPCTNKKCNIHKNQKKYGLLHWLNNR